MSEFTIDRLPERILAKMGLADGCWPWLGHTLPDGYGKVWHEGHSLLAHRVVYALSHGPIAPGLEIDHTCNTRNCVRPSHLEAVTPSENCLRREARKRARG